jgi:hypothetical protein
MYSRRRFMGCGWLVLFLLFAFIVTFAEDIATWMGL